MSTAKHVGAVLVAIIAVFAAAPGYATTINCPGFDGAGTCLQDILDDITVGGSSSVNVNTDQVADDTHWSLTNSGIGSSHIIAEISAFRNLNVVGIYDATDSSKRVEIFANGDAAGHKVSFSFDLNGSVIVADLTDFTVTNSNTVFAGNAFGWYLTNGQGTTFFSDAALNPDSPFDHMVAFQGQGDLVQLPGNPTPTTWDANGHILAFEDLLQSGGDADYNDFVFLVESTTPVPEPATLLLLGSGLVGAGFFGRKRLARKQG